MLVARDDDIFMCVCEYECVYMDVCVHVCE